MTESSDAPPIGASRVDVFRYRDALSSAAAAADLTVGERLVAFVLASCMEKDGSRCYPGVQPRATDTEEKAARRLTSRLGMSRSTVHAHLASLVAKGYLEQTERGVPHVTNAAFNATIPAQSDAQSPDRLSKQPDGLSEESAPTSSSTSTSTSSSTSGASAEPRRNAGAPARKDDHKDAMNSLMTSNRAMYNRYETTAYNIIREGRLPCTEETVLAEAYALAMADGVFPRSAAR